MPRLALLLLALLGGACAPIQPIKYEAADLKGPGRMKLVGKTMRVLPFEDGRRRIPENNILFTSGREASLRDETVCVNSEEQYEPGQVAPQITEMVVTHARQRRIFRA